MGHLSFDGIAVKLIMSRFKYHLLENITEDFYILICYKHIWLGMMLWFTDDISNL